MDNIDNIIILNDEAGNALRFEFLDLVTYRDENYVVLLPADEPDADEVVILQVEDSADNPEEENYLPVEDERILNAVFELFKQKFKDVFRFID